MTTDIWLVREVRSVLQLSLQWLVSRRLILCQRTQLLPDSQLDRFMVCLKLGYPSIENELDIVKGRTSANGFEEIHPVIGAAELRMIREEVTQVKVSDEVHT